VRDLVALAVVGLEELDPGAPQLLAAVAELTSSWTSAMVSATRS
jgi:hypothetical protein